MAINLFTHKHGRGGLLRVQQVGGNVFANAAAHQFHRGAEGFAFAEIPHHMQVAGAAGPAEIEVGAVVGGAHQVEFQAGIAHVAAHPAVAASIHHQAPQGPIGLNAQIDPTVLHLHRAGQQQPRRHGPAQQGGGQEGESMALASGAQGFSGGDRNQADATASGGGA